MTLTAILWDMDGTLIDSEPVHEQAFAAAIAALKLDIPPDTHQSLLGCSNIEVHQRLVELTGTAITLQEWRNIKGQYYRQSADNIKLMPHSRPILDALTTQGVPMALVSNSTREEVELNLQVTGLAGYFQVTISRDDVAHGKPAPDGYLAAARALAVPAAACLVIEDSVTGAKAGLAAGMTTLFHPETQRLVKHCPEGAILLPPDGDLAARLADIFNFQEYAMATIHWAGTGLSAIPGLRRLIGLGYPVRVYNRTVAKARQAIAGAGGDAEFIEFSVDKLRNQVAKDDIVVSMLPGDFHVPLAKICLEKGAHFVSSSYISAEMLELGVMAKAAGLCLVNEVGLDPGVDHSMAHALVADYMNSTVFDPANAHSFTSYCGGLSEHPNDFCYKFSWSPLGVLRALKSPSVSISNGAEYIVTKPWTAVTELPLDMPHGTETFEVYPNRDSRPFMNQYHFGEDWDVKQFVRGTLRYQGWKKAWQPIFAQVEAGMSDDELAAMSEQLWQQYALDEGESDRVVLAVTLKAEQDEQTVWHQSYLLDATGNAGGSAMAQLVSIPVSLAVEAILNGEIDAGVSAAPDKPELVARWMNTVTDIANHCVRIDHLAS